MPFDSRNLPALGAADPARRSNRVIVASWLFVVAAMLLVMVVLGGVTRLTGSGLSIMEWAPLSGTVPPLSDAEWHRLFGLYRTIPQFTLLHPDLDLAGFKGLFWLEWAHRLWGRLIALAFFGPLGWLWLTGRIDRRLGRNLLVLLAIGVAQGVIGWFMVASGFAPATTAVSAYRLAAHLAVALVIYAAVLWIALGVLTPDAPREPAAVGLRRRAMLLALMLAVTIVAGAFVAGLHAGLIYNTFPLMDGRLVPRDVAALTPVWRNLTENEATVQFDHRLVATLTLLTALVVGGTAVAASGLSVGLRLRGIAAALVVATQYALGVATLVAAAPIALAALHQLVALLALTAAIVLLHGLRGAR
jgi:cytochrome c oxidase assembly protein subunit 15